ncbi:MAG: Gfo/Idh/MocA family oxidoreductase [Lentisphaerae bacterium]|jgi:glucose-fructose oxidoreductase|nr:Gfo/Idh/MocA family oxidoreductase [Lentisphaerota bacterium]MBT5605110.1 Gfo/Idh/MocA family oxidoreductase [Lentisphaerota bacterium]MBT7055992.1 Gfo/Idh/MocA family oxidoreductase [Lentisphaerota bacterium]MBT7848145.1 Gfo/Idh/MocA family oxidoreductase [Lentisphaerota bacterium]
MSANQQQSRRGFLKRTASAGMALAMPTIIPSRVLGADAPSNRVAMAHIGVGGRGGGLCRSFTHLNNCRVTGVCDPFKSRRETHTSWVNQQYEGQFCTAHNDLREVLARDDIDAVVIATPDHWHVPAAFMALQNGKDVYVEKPLGISMRQNLALRDACHRYGTVFQYGTQQRSSSHIRFACELVRNGRIGKLQSVEVHSPSSGQGGSTTPIPVPKGFDYDLWLGPAPDAPYTKDRCTSNGSWFISDYALGFIAGWGAHPLDVAVWGLGDTWEAVPIEYKGTGVFPTEGLFDTATSWTVRGTYANGADFLFKGPGGNLTIFTGDKGKVTVSRESLETEPASLKKDVIGPDELHLYNSRQHYQNFVDCIRTRQPTVNPVDSAVYSDAISHLSDIAIRTGRTIKWAPEAETIVGDDQAKRMLNRTNRGPWPAG